MKSNFKVGDEVVISKQIDFIDSIEFIGIPGTIYSVEVEFKKTLQGVTKFNLITVDHPQEKFNHFFDTVYAEFPEASEPPGRFIGFYGDSRLFKRDSKEAQTLLLNRKRYDQMEFMCSKLFNLNEYDFQSMRGWWDSKRI